MMSLIRNLCLGLALFTTPITLLAEDIGTSNTATELNTVNENSSTTDADCERIETGSADITESGLLVASADNAGSTSYGCCRTCRVGKACGNTCISRHKTCHVGPGCACDAY